MNVPPDLLHRVRQWVDKAEEDLRAARHLLMLEEDCPCGTICFHAQQCAEKYLKAFLVFQSVEFPKIHDLNVLLNLAGGPAAFGVESLSVGSLNRYPVEARYPGGWDPIEVDESRRAVDAAIRVREAVRKQLPPAALNG